MGKFLSREKGSRENGRNTYINRSSREDQEAGVSGCRLGRRLSGLPKHPHHPIYMVCLSYFTATTENLFPTHTGCCYCAWWNSSYVFVYCGPGQGCDIRRFQTLAALAVFKLMRYSIWWHFTGVSGRAEVKWKSQQNESRLQCSWWSLGYHCGEKHCLWFVKATARGNLILPFSEWSGTVGPGRDGGGRFEFFDLLLSESGR